MKDIDFTDAYYQLNENELAKLIENNLDGIYSETKVDGYFEINPKIPENIRDQLAKAISLFSILKIKIEERTNNESEK